MFNSQDVDSEEENDTVHVIAENEKVVGELSLQYIGVRLCRPSASSPQPKLSRPNIKVASPRLNL